MSERGVLSMLGLPPGMSETESSLSQNGVSSFLGSARGVAVMVGLSLGLCLFVVWHSARMKRDP